MTADQGAVRPLHEIAKEIGDSWQPSNYAARPYLNAMRELDKITDQYGADTARSIVSYFLSNAQSWRGETARRVKAELRAMLGR